MTCEELYRRLGQTLSNPDQADVIYSDIWQQAGVDCAILVSDITGFTRITKEKGILQFLSGFCRAMQIAEPAVVCAGARFHKTAADNLVATFSDVPAAISAAREMIRTPIGFGIQFCIGIGYGRILHLEDDVFGDEVNVAYKLGEDIATADEVLVSAAAAIRAGESLDGPLHEVAGNVDLPHYRLRRTRDNQM